MDVANLINILNAIIIIFVFLLGAYAARRNRRLAQASGGEGIFLHHIPPLFIMINTKHPDCPKWVAEEYNSMRIFFSVCFIILLLLLYSINHVEDLFLG